MRDSCEEVCTCVFRLRFLLMWGRAIFLLSVCDEYGTRREPSGLYLSPMFTSEDFCEV